ncbi:MAG TPA: arylesterase [Blastocatellia bacterium]|nr:arylesterase [Blastocatellia bacterium]
MPVNDRKFKSRIFHALLPLLFLVALMNGCQDSKAVSDASSQSGYGAATPTQTATTASSPATADNRPLIVALGDSLTAGYGLETAQAWTTLLQQRLDERGFNYRVVNKGVSGDTSKGGLSRIEDALSGDVRVLILELGGNDGLRGLPPAELKKNLSNIIEAAQRRGIRVILAGMEAPPNFGDDYTSEFRNVYRELAQQFHLSLIPFFLQGVGGIAELNLPDGIHPNEKGSRIVLENVWKALEPVLK